MRLRPFIGILLCFPLSLAPSKSDSDLVRQYMGYLSSWSAYNSWRAGKASGPDPLNLFYANLQSALNFSSLSTKCEIEFPMFLTLARKVR